MRLRPLVDATNRLALILVCLSLRGLVAFFASWYIYSVAAGLYHCFRYWHELCYAVPFVAPFFIFVVATDSEGGDPRLTDILWLTLIGTILWTAIAIARRCRSD